MRVCLVIGQLGLGGAEKQLVLLATGLHERGVPTTVLTMFGGGEREADLHRAGVPVVDLGFRRLGDGWRALPGNVLALARLVRTLRRLRPDVVHAFLFHAYVLVPPAARLAGVRLVVAGRRSLGDFKAGRRWALRAERVATALTDHVVANAEAVAEDTLRRERIRPDKLSVVYNGLPDAAFVAARPVPLDVPGPVLLCVANLRRYKGHRYLLEAMARLSDKASGDGRPVTLLLAGEGPERAEIEVLARRWRLDVRVLGARTDVDRLLARADLVVLPSLTEGMSNAVAEAMAAGRPVVATDVGGTAELLTGRGVLVPPGDAHALAAAIAGLLADPGRAAELGAAARRWAAAHLRADVMVDAYRERYEGLLAGADAVRT
jgi:glycosyltransferase involved in cell wall biosynthesis